MHLLGWLRHRLNGKAGFEQQDGHCFENKYRVDLVAETRLLMPHGLHEELFVLKNQRDNSVQEVNCAQQQVCLLVSLSHG